MRKKTANRERRGRVEVSASEVKNAWHEYLDRVSRGREEVVVTRYGKPMMRMVPMEETKETPGYFGCLAGTVTVHGDIIAPIEDVWDAEG